MGEGSEVRGFEIVALPTIFAEDDVCRLILERVRLNVFKNRENFCLFIERYVLPDDYVLEGDSLADEQLKAYKDECLDNSVDEVWIRREDNESVGMMGGLDDMRKVLAPQRYQQEFEELLVRIEGVLREKYN